MTLRQLGQAIREARLKAGYSQNKLARELETSAQTIGYWERGVFKPNAQHYAALGDTISLKLDWLSWARTSDMGLYLRDLLFGWRRSAC